MDFFILTSDKICGKINNLTNKHHNSKKIKKALDNGFNLWYNEFIKNGICN